MIPNSILVEMLGSDLGNAVLGARTRLSDDTIECRIEAYDGRPGLCVVARGDVDLQAGMSHAAAITYLGGLA